MPKLHSQLALFGAIDQEVTNAKVAVREGAESDRTEAAVSVIELVEKFLPGTAGFGQNGWYAELTDFLSSDELRAPMGRRSAPAPTFPALPEAIGELVEIGNETEDGDTVLARASYAAIVLSKIHDLTGNRENDVLSILDRTLISWTRANSVTVADDLRSRIGDINDRASWLTQAAAAVGPKFAEGALPCFGALKKVNGRYCAYITTETTDDDLTVADIAKIVEPINWDNIFTEFFCRMTNQVTPYAGGASRISERISGECDKYFLDTALVFWKEKQKDGSIYINYDLDTNRDQDTGLVQVDSGYIVVTPKDPVANTGVRIRTSKLERVKGLSPTATAALACLLGWGNYAKQMLMGSKAREFMALTPPPHPPIYPFHRSPDDKLDFTAPVS